MAENIIGILGGTFDPVHFGHLRTALEVAEHFSVDAMHLIPGSVPPHRPAPLAEPHHRFAMLQTALAPEPRLQADARELQREGYSYTVDTLETFRAEFGRQCPLLLTVGFDAFQYFESWHRWQDILALAHLVIVHRPGYPVPPDSWYNPHLSDNLDDLRTTPAGKVYFLAVTALDISATDVRKRLKQGKNPRYLLPDSVIDYIKTHQLYCET
jgi:nicotinate-nucleotide adenylyltransferase